MNKKELKELLIVESVQTAVPREEDYAPNNPFGDAVEVYDIEREKELVREMEEKEESTKKMKIAKADLALWLFLALGFGWLLGRVTESIAVGNLRF